MSKKGARGELQVRDLLTPWWAQYEPDVKFARTPGSGGWLRSGDFDVAGDIVASLGPGKPSCFPFSVEVKWREDWSVDNVLTGKASPIWTWWTQCIRDAKKNDREPLLFFKKRREPWRCLLRRVFIEERLALITAGRRLRLPDVVWPHEIRSAKGEFAAMYQPCLYEADRFLKHPPTLFARAA